MPDKLQNQVPFYPNTDDDTHCVQACFKMALKYFLPKRDFSWEELDTFTHKLPGKGTWWFPALSELSKLGINTKLISPFNYQRFYEEGDKYLYEITTKEVADHYLQKTNLLDVKEKIPEFLKSTNIINRTAEISDIDRLLDENWLVGVDLNARTLNNKDGYSSHMVLIFANDGENYTFHDPGLPAQHDRIVNKKQLLKAWEYAGKNKKSLVAFNAPKNWKT